jgi:hypothetical protein
VNIDKLGRTLRKELTRSPKKSATLALGCVVALYFWTPLVWKWMPGAKPNKAPTAAAATTSAPAPLAVAAAEGQSTNKSAGKYGWNELVRWMGLDHRTKPATLDVGVRNPFRPTPAPQQALIDEPSQAADDPSNKATIVEIESPDPSPQQLGLILSGTIVGPRVRVATINGKTYREGAPVVVGFAGNTSGEDDNAADASDTQRIEFTLAEVHPKRIVLLRDGKPHELTIQRAKLADDERLIFNRASLVNN